MNKSILDYSDNLILELEFIDIILESSSEDLQIKVDLLKEEKIDNEKRLKEHLKKTNIDPSIIFKIINKHIGKIRKGNNIFTTMRDTTSDIFKELREEDLLYSIGKSLIILLFVIIANSVFQAFLAIRYGFIIAEIITAVIVAPIVEELGKFVASKNKSTGAHHILFNVTEFYLYFKKITDPVSMGGAGLSKMTAIKIRIPGLILHYVNTMIHKYFIKKAEDASFEKKKQYEKLGLSLAIIIHAAFNGLAVASSKLSR
ncbi:MAG: hypothetical protein H8D97_01145 [Proteobacteria bacterium]|nr:hypothetical protein [Pseudomonadota bacterium]